MNMKKLIFYILETENVNHANYIWNNKKNSMLSYADQKFYFSSYFSTKKEEIQVIRGVVRFDDEFFELIPELIAKSMTEARQISEEPIGTNKPGMNLSDALKHTINMWMNVAKEEDTIFHLSADLFIKIITGHYLTNGNKRTALAFLKLFLWHFGYYLKWSDGFWKNYEVHKTRVEIFVEKYQLAKNDIEKEQLRNEVISWIDDNVIIGLNWR